MPPPPLVSQSSVGGLGGSLSLGGSLPFPYHPRLWPAPPLGLSTNLLRESPFSLLPFLPRQPPASLPAHVTSPAHAPHTLTSSPIGPITSPLFTSAGAYTKESKLMSGEYLLACSPRRPAMVGAAFWWGEEDE